MTIRQHWRRLTSVLRMVRKFYRPGPGGAGYSMQASSGETYNYRTLEQAFRVNPWVKACTDRIADAVVDATLKVKRETAGGEIEDVSSGDAVGGDLVDLLEHPGARMTGSELIRDVASYLTIDGEGPMFINDGSAEMVLASGKPESLQVMKPRFIDKVVFLENGQISNYHYMQGADKRLIAPEFVIHPKTFNPYDDGRGLPTIQVATHPILLSWYMTRYAERFFQNDARPGGVLTSKHPLDNDIMQRNVERWEEAYKGVDNSWKVAALDADTTYQVVGTTAKDAEFIGLDKLTREQILAIFGVPPAVVGLTESVNYANAEQQLKLFYQFTVIPTAKLIASAINSHLIEFWYKGQGLYVTFDFSNVEALQGDKLKETQRHVLYIGAGVLSPNDVRQELGKEPRPGGDEYKPVDPLAGRLLDVVDADVLETKAPIDATQRDQWEAFDRLLMIGERAFYAMMVEYFTEQEKRILAQIAEVYGLSLDNTDAVLIPCTQRRVVESGLSIRRDIDPTLAFTIFDEEQEAKLLVEASMPVIVNTYERAGQRAILQVVPDSMFRVADPLVQDHMLSQGLKLGQDVTRTTRERIHHILVTSAADDASVGQMATRIRAEYDQFRRVRAVTIARTESLRASNGAAVDAYKQTGVVQKKSWLATLDASVRDTHAELNGVEVGINELFPIGNGAEAPGLTGDPAEDINCRCVVLPVVSKE